MELSSNLGKTPIEILDDVDLINFNFVTIAFIGSQMMGLLSIADTIATGFMNMANQNQFTLMITDILDLILEIYFAMLYIPNLILELLLLLFVNLGWTDWAPEVVFWITIFTSYTLQETAIIRFVIPLVITMGAIGLEIASLFIFPPLFILTGGVVAIYALLSLLLNFFLPMSLTVIGLYLAIFILLFFDFAYLLLTDYDEGWDLLMKIGFSDPVLILKEDLGLTFGKEFVDVVLKELENMKSLVFSPNVLWIVLVGVLYDVVGRVVLPKIPDDLLTIINWLFNRLQESMIFISVGDLSTWLDWATLISSTIGAILEVLLTAASAGSLFNLMMIIPEQTQSSAPVVQSSPLQLIQGRTASQVRPMVQADSSSFFGTAWSFAKQSLQDLLQVVPILSQVPNLLQIVQYFYLTKIQSKR